MRPAEPRVAGTASTKSPHGSLGPLLFSSVVVFLLGAQRHTEAYRSIAMELARRASGAAVRLPLDGACGGWKSSSSILWDQIEGLNADKMGTRTE